VHGTHRDAVGPPWLDSCGAGEWTYPLRAALAASPGAPRGSGDPSEDDLRVAGGPSAACVRCGCLGAPRRRVDGCCDRCSDAGFVDPVTGLRGPVCGNRCRACREQHLRRLAAGRRTRGAHGALSWVDDEAVVPPGSPLATSSPLAPLVVPH